MGDNKHSVINFKGLLNILKSMSSKGLIKSVRVNKYYIELRCSCYNIYKLLYFSKMHLFLKMDCLIDITVYNSLLNPSKFKICNDVNRATNYSIIYNLLSLTFNYRLFIYSELSKGFLIQSSIDLYKNSNWLEREVFDMFGIIFIGHTDLRRLLTDYGFSGNPLNKDFPLKGFYETYYSDGLGRLSFKRQVDFIQKYRAYFIKNPWFNYVSQNK